MKFSLAFLCLFFAYGLASRDLDRGRSGSGSSSGSRGTSGDRWGSGSSGSGLGSGRGACQWIRGHLKCADSSGKHDKNHVVVRLVDGSASGSDNVLDEAYSSQNGQFAVFGCSSGSSFRFKPELNVLHFCKSNRARKLRVPVPDSVQAGGEYNITSVIDLKAYYPEEQDYSGHIQLPCAV